MEQGDRRAHWDGRYRTVGDRSVSWFEEEPLLSMSLIDLVGATPATSVIDIGGGASALTSRLQQRGFADLTVLDVSTVALDASRGRVERPDEVAWVHADIVDWSPERRWAVWHDRAVFHFLTDPADRHRYRELLQHALEPNGAVILATFAEDGPTTCSGLAVERYSAEHLLAEIGPGFTKIASGGSGHVTPSGAIQPFVWVAARRSSD